MKKLSQISTSIKFKNPWWEYRFDTYELPNGDLGEYHYVYTAGSTFVIPVLDNGDIIMVEQFRYLNGRASLEFPGGGLPESVDPFENAKKELKEETGFTCNKINKLGVFNPYNGVTNEICHVYLASELESGEQDLEDSEEMSVKSFTQNEINKMISSNEIWDGMTLAAWSIFEHNK
jgi:ADP-ribose pyrophosphatase